MVKIKHDGIITRRKITKKKDDKNCPYVFDYYMSICQDCDWFDECYDRACKAMIERVKESKILDILLNNSN